jgi:SecD/SecF fusion protein
MAGAPVDVAPKERRRRSVTTPPDPTRGVSSEEFEEMVRELGIEEAEERQPAAARASGRPAGGRRARSRAAKPDGSKPQGDGTEKPKKPRNRRHGRPR